MRTKQNISIKIADVSAISLTIAPEAEAGVREAERGVNEVWRKWRARYSDKSSKEVLAMVAYQYAKLYFQQIHFNEEVMAQIGGFEKELDQLLELVSEDNQADSAPDSGGNGDDINNTLS